LVGRVKRMTAMSPRISKWMSEFVFMVGFALGCV
jgi:hypothetical protein